MRRHGGGAEVAKIQVQQVIMQRRAAAGGDLGL
jgi:hypothetical protein